MSDLKVGFLIDKDYSGSVFIVTINVLIIASAAEEQNP